MTRVEPEPDLPAGTLATALFTGLLPTAVAVVECAGGAPDEEPGALFPEERVALTRAHPARRREFAAVRACARAAMVRLGRPPAAVPAAGEGPTWSRNAPRWPEGLVGSMTHCSGYRAAAVAATSSVRSLGIDAEPHAPLTAGVRALALLPEERQAVARWSARRPGVAFDRVVFSAKESVFKAWYPLTGLPLGFAQCHISLAPDDLTFTAVLRCPRPLSPATPAGRFEGRWHATPLTAFVTTAVVVPAP